MKAGQIIIMVGFVIEGAELLQHGMTGEEAAIPWSLGRHDAQQVERAAGIGAFAHVEHGLVADADFLPAEAGGDATLADRDMRLDKGLVEVQPAFLDRGDDGIEAGAGRMFEIDEGAEQSFDLEVAPDAAALLEIAVIILRAAAPAFAQPQFGAQAQFTAQRGI
ncbi:hypothetical protein LTR94_032203, partial [Friedmanniomyces endolithicus]